MGGAWERGYCSNGIMSPAHRTPSAVPWPGTGQSVELERNRNSITFYVHVHVRNESHSQTLGGM